MKKYLVIIFLFVLFEHNEVFSQIKGDGHIPPEPTTFEFIKHNFMKANYYSGLPEISIPIYTIELRSFRLPIYLGYNYSGLQVNEVPSNTGLGWSLSYGGSISLLTNGKPDDTPGTGYNTVRDLLNIPDPIEESMEYAEWMMNLTEDQKRKIADGFYDMVPDIYYLSVAGINVKFIQLKNGEYFPISYSPIKINRLASDKWEVLDENGTKYIFGQLNSEDAQGVQSSFVTSTVNGGNTEFSQTNTSWHLREIITKEGESITFDYILEQYDRLPSNTHTLYFNNSTTAECLDMYKAPINSRSEVSSFNTHRISEIEFPSGKILFEGLTNRTDVNGNINKRLDNIVLEDYKGNRINRTKLTYDYLNNNKRLILTSIQKFGRTDSDYNPAYQFSYDQSNVAPEYSSYSQDHWGYFNGRNNPTLVPKYIFNSPYNSQFSEGGDRSPDFNYSVTGALNKITYPTGGVVEYEYEENDYGFINTEMVSEDYYDLINDYEDLNLEYTNNVEIGSKILAPQIDQIVEIEYNIDHNRMIDDDLPYVKIICSSCQNQEPIFEKYNISNGTASLNIEANHSYIIEAGVYENTDQSFIRVNYKSSASGNKSKNKVAGGIRLKKIIEKESEEDLSPKTKFFNYSSNAEQDRSSGVLLAEPEYEYHLNANSIIYMAFGGGFVPTIGPSCNVIARTGNSVFTLQSGDGHIGYKEVEVLNGVGGEHGSTIYKYSSANDFKDVIFRNSKSISYKHYRGRLINKTIYNSNKEKVNEVRYKYEFHNTPNLDKPIEKGIPAILNIGYIQNDPQNTNDVFTEPYHAVLKANWIYLKEITNVKFDGLDSLKTFEKHFYDNPQHAQLTRKQNQYGDRDTWEYFVYPSDFSDNNPTNPISTLATHNVLSTPIESLKFEELPSSNSKKIVAGSLSHYSFFDDQYNSIPRLSKHLMLESDILIDGQNFKISNKLITGDFLPTESINGEYLLEDIDGKYNTIAPQFVNVKYDQSGNTIEFINNQSIRTSILRGYNNSAPFLIANNVTHNELRLVFIQALESVLGTSISENAELDFLVDEYLYDLDFDNNADQVFYNNLIDELKSNEALKFWHLFLHKPLVGLSSISDQNGLTKFYKYDGMNRLLNIKDNEKNILKQFKYNYIE